MNKNILGIFRFEIIAERIILFQIRQLLYTGEKTFQYFRKDES